MVGFRRSTGGGPMWLWLIVTCIAVALATGAHAQETPCRRADNVAKNEGGCWRSLSLLEKQQTILGFWAGSQARGIADDLIDRQASYSDFRDWLKIPPKTSIQDITEYFD